jgi:hypothetical protein
MGGVSSISPAFSISFAMACGSSINAAVHAYGRLLTSSKRAETSAQSPELQLLGYATDNGAYYYYKVLLFPLEMRMSRLICLSTSHLRPPLVASTAPR